VREAYRSRRVVGAHKKHTRVLVTWELQLSCGHLREFTTTKPGAPEGRVRCFDCGQRAEWRRASAGGGLGGSLRAKGAS